MGNSENILMHAAWYYSFVWTHSLSYLDNVALTK